MFRAADHDDARTMLLSSQVLRLARLSCGPTVAGQCRTLTGFPWLNRSLSDGAVIAQLMRKPRAAGHPAWESLLLTLSSRRGTVTSASSIEQSAIAGEVR